MFKCAPAVKFSRTGGRCFLADLYNRWRRFWCACQRVGRASVLSFLFFADREVVFWGDLYSRRRRYMPAGQEGMRAEPFSLASLQWNFHGAGGRRGKGLGGSLPSAATFLVYACQRVRRASGLNFIVALAPLNFPRPRGGGFDGYSPSAAVFSVYACQGVGRANGVNVVLSALPLLNFLGPGGGIFWQISTTGGGAFGIICMSASREGELGEPFFFCATVARLVWSGWARGAGFGGSLHSTAALFVYSYKLYREDGRTEFVFIRLRISVFPDQGAVFSGDLYSRRRRFWWIRAMETGGEACCTVPFCTSAVDISRIGGAKGSGFWWIATLGGGAFGICMPACREGERTELCFYARAVRFSRTGGRCFWWIPTFGGGVFAGIFIPAGREGKRGELCFFYLPLLNFHGPRSGVF